MHAACQHPLQIARSKLGEQSVAPLADQLQGSEIGFSTSSLVIGARLASQRQFVNTSVYQQTLSNPSVHEPDVISYNRESYQQLVDSR